MPHAHRSLPSASARKDGRSRACVDVSGSGAFSCSSVGGPASLEMDRAQPVVPRSASSSAAAPPAGSTGRSSARLTRAADVTAASAASSANGAAASSQSVAASARPAAPASLPASASAGSGRVTEQLRSHLQRELSSAESAMDAALRARGISLTGGTAQATHLGEEVLRRRQQQAQAQAQQQAHPQPRLLASLFPTDAFSFPPYPSSSVVVAPVRAAPPAHACQTCGSVAPPSKQQQQQSQMPEKAGANGPTQMARCTGCRVVHCPCGQRETASARERERERKRREENPRC